MQMFMIVAIVAAASLFALAVNLGPTASIREKRGLKWLAALGPIVSIIAVGVALQQLALSRQSNERQDRAYMFVNQLQVNLNAGAQATVDFRQKNYGKTAAFDMYGSTSCRLYDWPVKFGPYTGALGQPLNRSILPPGDDLISTAKCGEPITTEDIEQLRQGRKALILIGDIQYRDIFQVAHRYVFRRMVGGHVGLRENWMATTPENDEMD